MAHDHDAPCLCPGGIHRDAHTSSRRGPAPAAPGFGGPPPAIPGRTSSGSHTHTQPPQSHTRSTAMPGPTSVPPHAHNGAAGAHGHMPPRPRPQHRHQHHQTHRPASPLHSHHGEPQRSNSAGRSRPAPAPPSRPSPTGGGMAPRTSMPSGKGRPPPVPVPAPVDYDDDVAAAVSPLLKNVAEVESMMHSTTLDGGAEAETPTWGQRTPMLPPYPPPSNNTHAAPATDGGGETPKPEYVNTNFFFTNIAKGPPLAPPPADYDQGPDGPETPMPQEIMTSQSPTTPLLAGQPRAGRKKKPAGLGLGSTPLNPTTLSAPGASGLADRRKQKPGFSLGTGSTPLDIGVSGGGGGGGGRRKPKPVGLSEGTTPLNLGGGGRRKPNFSLAGGSTPVGGGDSVKRGKINRNRKSTHPWAVRAASPSVLFGLGGWRGCWLQSHTVTVRVRG